MSEMSDRDRDKALLAITCALNDDRDGMENALAGIFEQPAREFWIILRGVQDVIEGMDGGAEGRPWE